jgi:DNA-binding Lrp family transcriptional regulator
MITAFVLIQAQPQAIAALGQALADIDGVREAHSVAGSETDVVAIVSVTDHEAVARIVTERIAKLDGITGTTTMIAFRSYSSAQLDASYEGFG